MEAIRQEQLLSRSKSTGFLDKIDNEFDFKCFSARFCGYNGSDNPHASVSSVEPCFECDGTGCSGPRRDSGISRGLVDGDALLALERKIDKVSELLQEQHDLLMSIKEKINKSNTDGNHQHTASTICTEKDSGAEELILTNETKDETPDGDDEASAARSLLAAIELKRDTSLDNIIKLALENFLQSDSVAERVAATTAACVRGAVAGGVWRAAGAYLPLLQRAHRRLVQHVTQLLDDSFADLEESTASWFKSIHKSSRGIRAALEKHQHLLEATDPTRNITLLQTTLKSVLEDEVRSWLGRAAQELAEGGAGGDDPPYSDDGAPASPMQPPNPGSSPIDTLMQCAVIKKHIEDGDVCGAFELALNARELALVVAACRAAAPRAAARLRPAARLALLQQLAADMVHDTQLKCRYLEEVILRLAQCDAADAEEAAARAHLPRVLRDVRRSLARFLAAYPKHAARRRVALIVMAADNLA